METEKIRGALGLPRIFCLCAAAHKALRRGVFDPLRGRAGAQVRLRLAQPAFRFAARQRQAGQRRFVRKAALRLVAPGRGKETRMNDLLTILPGLLLPDGTVNRQAMQYLGRWL